MPESAWAEVQWPRLAPDGSQLAYTKGKMLMRMSLVGAEVMPESESVTKCASRCEFRWESSRTLLVIDDRDLVRVSIGDDGVAVQLQVADDDRGRRRRRLIRAVHPADVEVVLRRSSAALCAPITGTVPRSPMRRARGCGGSPRRGRHSSARE